MFTEPYFWCPFCAAEVEEFHDFPPPDQWEKDETNDFHYAWLSGKCVNCGRVWQAKLGEPDPNVSYHNEVLSLEVIA